MAVIDVEITSRSLFAEGHASDSSGPYERIDGVLTFAADPEHPANRDIVDLALARRDGDGRVRFAADFTLLAPVESSKGNGRLIVDVVNRGHKRVVRTFNMASPLPEGSTEIPPGDGFLFRRGFSVVSIGWQWDVFRSELLMGLDAPIAKVDDRPVEGQVLVEFRPDSRQTTRTLANRIHRPYTTANLDDPSAQLLVRDWEDGPYTEVPRADWRFARETADGPVLSAEHVFLSSGFEPGKIYHLVYTTATAPVAGAGLLAVRDVGAWLRHPSALNPVDGFERAYCYGVSQTGRMLRHFIYLGLNQDEEGRQVYDGLMPHVAGGRRGEFNHRFAQPSVQSTPGFGHLFPFADDETVDPMSGASDGLLSRARAQGTVPHIIYTNSAAEYWRGDGSLTHIVPGGERDLAEAPQSRTYLFAGTQHGLDLPQPSDSGVDGTWARYAQSVVDYRPLLRAALVNLDAWVSTGVEPPPSKHPRVDDGTAVSRGALLASLEAVAGLAKPDPDRLWVLRETELGSGAAHGVATYPVVEGRAYECCVSAVDADGNELAGIRLPDLTVPVGTHSGWNPRHPDSGAPEQVIPMRGFTIPFAPTREARERAGDRRPAIEERYAGRDAYVDTVREEARRLAAERYLLEEDVEVVVARCAALYDEAMAGTLVQA